MNKFDIHVGMPVVMVANDRFNFTGKKGTIIHGKVSRIGRKWFYVQPDDRGAEKEQRFSVDKFLHDNGEYSPSFSIFQTEANWEAEKERRMRLQIIQETIRFPRKRLSVEAVNGIWDILRKEGVL